MAKGKSKVGNKESFHDDSRADIKPSTPIKQTPYFSKYSRELNPQTRDAVYPKPRKDEGYEDAQVLPRRNDRDYERQKKEVIEYFMLNKDYSPSLIEIMQGTGLDEKSVLEIMCGLASEGVVDFRLNFNDKKTKELYKKYGEKLANGLEAIWGRAK